MSDRPDPSEQQSQQKQSILEDIQAQSLRVGKIIQNITHSAPDSRHNSDIVPLMVGGAVITLLGVVGGAFLHSQMTSQQSATIEGRQEQTDSIPAKSSSEIVVPTQKC